MKAKKKVLIATNTTGFLWFIWDDFDILRDLGYEIVVAADNSQEKAATLEEVKRRGARFVNIPITWGGNPLTRTNIHAFRSFCRLISNEKFDAIICHTSITGVIVRLCARLYGKPDQKIIYMCHGLPWNHLSGWGKKLLMGAAERFASRFCDAIITINEEDRLTLSSMHCHRVYKVDSVGCDVARFRDAVVDRAAKRNEIGVDENQIVVMAVGIVNERKNHTVIARAIASLPEPERFCYVVCGREPGDGSRSREIQAIGREAGFEVKMLGARSDVPELMHIADIGVIPSLSEGFGMVGVEQLSAGVPVIGTNVQGIPSYVIDGKTGFLVDDPHDVDAFAAALDKLADENVRQSMKAHCVAMACRFDKKHALEQRKAIYASELI